MKKAIIIPCHNVAEQFEIMDFVNLLIGFDEHTIFCLVNDGSSDPTRSVLSLAKDYVEDKVLIYHLDRPHGRLMASHLGADFLRKETDIEEIYFAQFENAHFDLNNVILNKIPA